MESLKELSHPTLGGMGRAPVTLGVGGGRVADAADMVRDKLAVYFPVISLPAHVVRLIK